MYLIDSRNLIVTKEDTSTYRSPANGAESVLDLILFSPVMAGFSTSETLPDHFGYDHLLVVLTIDL